MTDQAQRFFRSPVFWVVTAPLSFLFGLLVSIRNLLYDFRILKTHQVGVPVISVGNISTGGSGKTILIQSLAKFFLENGRTPAILSRGYGRKTSGLQIVADAKNVIGSVRASGDEPYMMAINLPGVPVVVSEDRVSGAEYIEKNFSVDVILLDDGFQHRRLHRDLDILLKDNSGLVVPRLLPWGDLREGPGSVRRADVILKSKSQSVEGSDDEFKLAAPSKLVNHSAKPVGIEVLASGFGLFAGLGNNEAFFRFAEDAIGPPVLTVSLPDHSEYSEGDLRRIPLNECPVWVTTQKDMIKLSASMCETHHVYYLGVKGELPAVLLGALKHYLK